MRTTVCFDHTVEDWEGFVDGLNESLPEDAVVDFRFGNPLQHEYFCPFISKLNHRWAAETNLVGPGLRCLMINPGLSRRCEEIIAKFDGRAIQVGLIPWLGQLVKLKETGYNVRAETPRPIDLAWLKRYAKTKVSLRVDVVHPAEEPKRLRGFSKSISRDCDGERAIIWKDGKYYPCDWCLGGGLKHPVYSYGEFGEPFEKKGKQECHLRFCPLE